MLGESGQIVIITDMRKFSIRRLLFLTALVAFAFAIARLIDFDTAGAALLMIAVFAPCVCYGIAEVVAPVQRSLRRAMRSSLLAVLFGIFVATCVSTLGSSSLPTLLFVLFVVWAPQLFLLRSCSWYRCTLVGSL